jgi:hypothetical protein
MVAGRGDAGIHLRAGPVRLVLRRTDGSGPPQIGMPQ